MGQLCLAEHAVADGVDAGDVGLHPVVDQNTAAVVADAAGLQIQRRRVGLAADGYQHLLRFKCNGIAALGGADNLRAHRGRLHSLHRALQREGDAHLLHVGHAHRRQIAVQHGQHMIHGLHHGDAGAESRVGAGQLKADDAAADDHHALRQLFQTQRAGRIDAVGVLADTRNGGHGVDGAGGHDDGIGGHFLGGAVGLGDADALFTHKGGLAVDLLHLVQLQQTGHAAGQLLADGVLMGDDLGEVDLNAFHLHTDLLALILDILQQFGAVEQALGGDAAHVQAGAAQMLLLHHCDLRAQLRGTDGGHIAAGATADDDDGLLARRRGSGGCGGSGSRGGSGRGCGGGRGCAGYGLAGLADVGDDALAGARLTLRQEDLQQYAVGVALHVVGQLIGGHGEQDIALFDGIALFEFPLLDGAFRHGQAHLGHQYFGCHRNTSFP